MTRLTVIRTLTQIALFCQACDVPHLLGYYMVVTVVMTDSHANLYRTYPDDIARLWHSDGHVLAEWFYCDHQGALAIYGITALSVLLLGKVSVCFTQPGGEKWRSVRPGSTQCE